MFEESQGTPLEKSSTYRDATAASQPNSTTHAMAQEQPSERSGVAETVSQMDDPAVTIYTVPDCPGCALTTKALNKAGIQATIVNLKDRPDLAQQFRSQGFYAAPILETPDGTRTAGFRPDRVRHIISSARHSDTSSTQLEL